MAEKPRNMIEEKRWYKETRAIITLIGAVIAITGAAIGVYQHFRSSPTGFYYEFILDSSLRMLEEFEDKGDNKTKWKAAIEAVEKYIDANPLENNTKVALRICGKCDLLSENPEVGFSAGNKNKIKVTIQRKYSENI